MDESLGEALQAAAERQRRSVLNRREGLPTKLLQGIGGIPMSIIGAGAGLVDASRDMAAEQLGTAPTMSTDYDPRRVGAGLAAETAMNIVGTPALTGGVPASALGSGAQGIRAWHASPYDFEKFDLSALGKGQGSASYGPGIYAAESPAVSGVGGEYWKEFNQHRNLTLPQRRAGKMLEEHGFDTESAIRAAERDVADAKNMLDQTNAHGFKGETLKNAENVYFDMQKRLELLAGGKAGPRVYELNINADPQSFLQWDRPLPDQPQQLRDFVAATPQVNQRVSPNDTGGLLFGAIGRGVTHSKWRGHGAVGERADQAAMDALRDAGIPGVRYADQMSRGHPRLESFINRMEANPQRTAVEEQKLIIARKEMQDALAQGPPTYNYVLNNPDIIEIMRKLGIAGAAAVPTAASVFGPALEQNQ